MKIVKHTLMFLACSAAISSFAQTSPPPCGATNFDSSKNVFTVINPAADAVNQQCLLTVYPSGRMPSEAQQNPASYIVEGSYTIELSGGGGGGGGGAEREAAGGGGGAGAAPARTVQYLSPGVYKLTLGAGGEGGSAGGGRTESGNPSSLTNARTGQLIAGFPGADRWTQRSTAAGAKGDGLGGQAKSGGSSGGSGGGTGGEHHAAQAGGMSQTAGNSGTPGQAGTERRSDNERDAGGGGGAGVGSGGVGGSANGKSAVAAGSGDLGGGGGGGRGGEHNAAEAGGHGGQGFIKLTRSGPARQAIALAPEASAQDSEITQPAPVDARPARKDRN